MPGQTDLIVKNAANVDKTFKAIAPAAGDGGVAEWALSEGTIATVFPRLTASARKTKAGRNLHLKFFVPASYTDTVTGLTVVTDRAEWNVTVSLPSSFPEARKDDVVAFGGNLLATALIKQMMRDSLGAT